MYRVGQSEGRRSFTVGHEFANYILHRQLVEADGRFDGGIYCDENAVVRRGGSGIEQEADEFAAALLMPLHEFRRQLLAKARVDFEVLGRLARRYGVSLTAAILRWLEYTETRAIVVVSNEGFAHWAKTSTAALKSGRHIRPRATVFELPAQAFAARRDHSDVALTGTTQQGGVWFPEPVHEMCFRSDRYDQEITVLQFDGGAVLPGRRERDRRIRPFRAQRPIAGALGWEPHHKTFQRVLVLGGVSTVGRIQCPLAGFVSAGSGLASTPCSVSQGCCTPNGPSASRAWRSSARSASSLQSHCGLHPISASRCPGRSWPGGPCMGSGFPDVARGLWIVPDTDRARDPNAPDRPASGRRIKSNHRPCTYHRREREGRALDRSTHCLPP